MVWRSFGFLAGMVALSLAGVAHAKKEPSPKTLVLSTVTTARIWVDGERYGTGNPVNTVDGSWTTSSVTGPDDRVLRFGDGVYLGAVIRAPGYYPVFRTFDTGVGRVSVPLRGIAPVMDYQRSLNVDASAIAEKDKELLARPADDPQARAYRASKSLSDGKVANAPAAVAEAEAVLAAGAEGRTRLLALSTVALGQMLVWKQKSEEIVAGPGYTEESVRALEGQRALVLAAAKAWVAADRTDPQAVALCVTAEGAFADCGVDNFASLIFTP